KGGDQLNLFVGERTYGSTGQHKHPDQSSFSQERYAEDGVVSADSLMLDHPVFRIGSSIEDMNRRTFKQHATDRTLPPGFPGRTFRDVLQGKRHLVGRLRAEKTVVFRAPNISDIGLAQSCSRLEEGVEHGLKVERRAADDLEHVRGRGLLRQ